MARLVGAVAWVGVVLGLTACGNGDSGGSTTADAPAEIGDVTIRELFNGTPAARQAIGVARFRAGEQAMADCMAVAGFADEFEMGTVEVGEPEPVLPDRDVAPRPADEVARIGWGIVDREMHRDGPVGTVYRSGSVLLPGATTSVSPAVPTSAASPFDVAAGNCADERSRAQAEHPLPEDLLSEEASSALWSAHLRSDESAAYRALVRRYRTCMTDAGYADVEAPPVDLIIDGLGLATNKSETAEELDAALDELQQRETELAVADRECRVDLVPDLRAARAASERPVMEQYADEVARVQAAWQDAGA